MSKLSFDKDSEIQINLKSIRNTKIEVNDAQLNPLKNSLISETLGMTLPTQINGVNWNVGQSQSIPGNAWYIFSPTGKFQIAYYPIEGLKAKFKYWEKGSLYGPDGSVERASDLFFVEDFSEIYLCFPINFDSSKSTNKNCFENALPPRMNERAAQEAAIRVAAEKLAAEKAAIAAAERKAARDQAVASTKKTTITCVKGKVSKKVTAVKPKCPSGYKLKN